MLAAIGALVAAVVIAIGVNRVLELIRDRAANTEGDKK